MSTMRRIEVACTECRRRKLKCNGTRPTCSRCKDLCLDCSYKPLSSRLRDGLTKRDKNDLRKRVEMLEQSLLNSSKSLQQASSLTDMSSEHQEDSLNVSTTLDEDISVDILSTDAFHQTSENEVGYFGPSSNYAMFRLLSKVFADTTMLYMPTNRAAPLLESCSKCGNHDKHSANRVVSNQLDHLRPAPEKSSPREMYILPSKQEAVFLFGTFFRDIGTIFPYISEVDILDQYQKSRMQQPPKFRAVFLALLNIIWAHACASQSKVQRETFYNRAVVLLDLRTLERPGYELVQTLLLMVTYKQNHQRSISSYTTHALCVKAAFHVGLHSERVLMDCETEERHKRVSLWEAVVRNDRLMGLTQGQPYMIPQSLGVSGNCSINSSSFEKCFTSCLETVIETLYNGNIETATICPTQSLVLGWESLNWKLTEWFNDILPGGLTISSTDLSNSFLVMDKSVANRILLSIDYHRLRITSNFPLISHFLTLTTTTRKSREFEIERLKQALHRVIEDDTEALRELRNIFHAISTSHESFMVKFACWYTCHYTILTVTMHYLAILLVGKHAPDIVSASSMIEIRQDIDQSLDTLKNIGKSSLVTQRARCCIKQLLSLFDTLGDEPRSSTRSSTPPISLDFMDTEIFLQSIQRPSDELLNQFARDDFGELDQSFLDIYSRLPLCE